MHTSEHESHGVHLCHKCGWPFPNPHPSAKHRRAHKKVCGTIEGYKLIESHDLNLSDEERHSDEDRTTPSPKPVEKSSNEKHNSEISGRSKRSEEEVFSDAVTEFTDSGLSPELQHNLEIEKMPEKKDLTVFYSFKDSAVADIIEPPGNSTDGVQITNPEVPENTDDPSHNNLEPQVHVFSSNEIPVDDKNLLSHDLVPIKPKLPVDASQEVKIINAGEDVTKGLMAYGELEANVKGNGEFNSGGNVVLLSPGECTGQTFGLGSNTQEKEIKLDPMPSDGNVILKEEHGAGMASEISLSDPTTEVEFVHMGSADAAQVKVDAQQGLGVVCSVNSCEGLSEMGEGKENVHELSVPSDIPEVDHAEVMLKDFKDYKGLKFLQSATSDSVSSEITIDKRDDVEDPLSVDNFTHFHSVQSSEVTKASASEMNVLEDNLLLEGRMPMIKNLSSEGKRDDHQQILNEVNPRIASLDANAMNMNDSGHEKANAEMDNLAGKDENERPRVESYEEIRVTTLEAATNLPEFLVNPATNLHESDEAGDHEKAKVEKCDVTRVASVGQSAEGNHSLQTETTCESGSILHESLVDAGNVVNVSETKSPETKFTNLDGVSTTLDVIKQLEIDGNDKTQGECVTEHGRDVEILDRNSEDHAMKDCLVSPSDTEVSIQTSVAVDDNHTKKLGAEDSGINQSLQVETDDNNSVKHQFGASVVDVSVDSLSQTDSVEGNWGSISVLSTQSDTPAVADSETLPSTDYPTSKEAEETNSKKPEGIIKRQQSEKSDVFEAPSFMTLVEPGGGIHHKGSASAIQTAQNPQQQKVPSSQAGWFPSLTNVVNESQGRKKNEEIIAKVTNWSAGKQHTPLKNLLSEANLETKPKSPNSRENKTPVVQKDETTRKDNGALAPTVSLILSSGVPTTEPAKRETRKEYDSPAGYPADIKREKRRPYWAQFMCCSSVN